MFNPQLDFDPKKLWDTLPSIYRYLSSEEKEQVEAVWDSFFKGMEANYYNSYQSALVNYLESANGYLETSYEDFDFFLTGLFSTLYRTVQLQNLDLNHLSSKGTDLIATGAAGIFQTSSDHYLWSELYTKDTSRKFISTFLFGSTHIAIAEDGIYKLEGTQWKQVLAATGLTAAIQVGSDYLIYGAATVLKTYDWLDYTVEFSGIASNTDIYQAVYDGTHYVYLGTSTGVYRGYKESLLWTSHNDSTLKQIVSSTSPEELSNTTFTTTNAVRPSTSLLTNGSFLTALQASHTAADGSWTAYNSIINTSDDHLVVRNTLNTGVAKGYAYQSFQTVSGTRYKVTGKHFAGNASGKVYVNSGSNIATNQVTTSDTLATNTDFTFYFTATSTTTYVSLVTDSVDFQAYSMWGEIHVYESANFTNWTVVDNEDIGFIDYKNLDTLSLVYPTLPSVGTNYLLKQDVSEVLTAGNVYKLKCKLKASSDTTVTIAVQSVGTTNFSTAIDLTAGSEQLFTHDFTCINIVDQELQIWVDSATTDQYLDIRHCTLKEIDGYLHSLTIAVDTSNNFLYSGTENGIYKSETSTPGWSHDYVSTEAIKNLTVYSTGFAALTNNAIYSNTSNTSSTWQVLHTLSAEVLYKSLIVLNNKLFVLGSDGVKNLTDSTYVNDGHYYFDLPKGPMYLSIRALTAHLSTDQTLYEDVDYVVEDFSKIKFLKNFSTTDSADTILVPSETAEVNYGETYTSISGLTLNPTISNIYFPALGSTNPKEDLLNIQYTPYLAGYTDISDTHTKMKFWANHLLKFIHASVGRLRQAPSIANLIMTYSTLRGMPFAYEDCYFDSAWTTSGVNYLQVVPSGTVEAQTFEINAPIEWNTYTTNEFIPRFSILTSGIAGYDWHIDKSIIDTLVELDSSGNTVNPEEYLHIFAINETNRIKDLPYSTDILTFFINDYLPAHLNTIVYNNKPTVATSSDAPFYDGSNPTEIAVLEALTSDPENDILDYRWQHVGPFTNYENSVSYIPLITDKLASTTNVELPNNIVVDSALKIQLEVTDTFNTVTNEVPIYISGTYRFDHWDHSEYKIGDLNIPFNKIEEMNT